MNYYQSVYDKPFRSKDVFDPNTAVVNSDGTIDCSDCAEYSVSTNTNGTDKMRGMGITLTYNFNNGYRIGGSYANIDMAIDTSKSFTKTTSRPKNRMKFSLSNPNIYKDIGAALFNAILQLAAAHKQGLPVHRLHSAPRRMNAYPEKNGYRQLLKPPSP